ncbi:MAG: NAD+ synthase, partial [Syntrophomonas sp.]
SDLVILPELVLVGYPPRDLLERSWFIDRIREAVRTIIQVSNRYPETALLFGIPEANEITGKGLYNSAVLVYQGDVLATQAKSLLPIYDVFDEARYFDPAAEISVIPFKDELIGISICEDAWNDSEFWPRGRIYDFDPVGELARQGATLLVNISASPFHAGKEEIRYRLIRNHARRHGLPFVYVNQVGGNDELIFDGRSMMFSNDGTPVYISPAFKEDFRTIDLSEPGTEGLFKSQDVVESVYQALALGIRDYMHKLGFKKTILGLSGGIDSALTACLAKEAVGAENVVTISMPSPYSSIGSVEDSRKLASNLGIDFKVIPISPLYQTYLDSLGSYFAGREADGTEENIQARIRGNILMAFSNKYGYLVLSTGNKSEMAVGYCTLYGDMSGGLSVLADVPKTMVYELTAFINREEIVIPPEIISKPPSAELKPDQLDQDVLPPYDILDKMLHYYIEEGLSAEELTDLGFDPETVRWVVKAVDRNEYKRRQAAPGLKVTTKAFGTGRRMPIAARIPHRE